MFFLISPILFSVLIRRSSMAWTKVFLLALCINFGTIHGLDAELKELSNEAVERGREWIWNQRDPLTDFWPRGEVITAILGKFFLKNTFMMDLFPLVLFRKRDF